MTTFSEKIVRLRRFALFLPLVRPQLPLIGVMLVLLFCVSLMESLSYGMLVPLIGIMTSHVDSQHFIIRWIAGIYGYLGLPFSTPALLFGFLALIVFKNIAFYFEELAYIHFRRKIVLATMNRSFENLLEFAYEFFHSQSRGNILFRTTGVPGTLGELIALLNRIMLQLVLVLGYVFLLFLISPAMAGITILAGSPIFFGMRHFFARTKFYSQKNVEAAIPFNSAAVELVDMIKLIKASGLEAAAGQRFSSSAEAFQKTLFHLHRHSILLTSIQQPIVMTTLVVVILLSLHVFHISLGSLAIFLVIAYKILPASHVLISLANNVYAYAPSLNVILETLEKDNKPYLPNGNLPFPALKAIIDFKNVSFAYRGRQAVLEKIDLRLEKGKVIALVGETGSGKSTIVDLLLRLYDPKDGVILVDGVDLRRFDILTWRRRIGLVLQDVQVVNNTVGNNIRFAWPQATDGEVIQAAKIANAHGFISALPEGYDTLIGEKGIRLSGGQKQMLCLARAIIRKPELLILDEATSSLDSESEKAIQEAIYRLKGDLTMLIVAHRLSTVMEADRIAVLDGGRIVESGTHDELMRRNGRYANFVRVQTNAS